DSNRNLAQADGGARGKMERVGTQNEQDSLGRVSQIERRRFAEAARADRAEFSLAATAAGHVEFINHAMLFDIRHLHVQREQGAAGAEIPKEETPERAAAIDDIKLTFDEPANLGNF